MSERKFPSLTVSGLVIHTAEKFPSNVGRRDDKQRDVAEVLWDSEGDTETVTEDYDEACDWAALFAAAPRLLTVLGRLSVACGEASALTASGLGVPMSVWREVVEANNAAAMLIAEVKVAS